MTKFNIGWIAVPLLVLIVVSGIQMNRLMETNMKLEKGMKELNDCINDSEKMYVETINHLTEQNQKLIDENYKLALNNSELNAKMHVVVDLKKSTYTRSSAYTARTKECDSTPHLTATMTKPKAGKTIAVSRDLSYMLGWNVEIEGLGTRKVEDLMNPRYKNTIDIVFPSVSEAMKYGRRSAKLTVLDQ